MVSAVLVDRMLRRDCEVFILPQLPLWSAANSGDLKDLFEDPLVSEFPDVFRSLQSVPSGRSDPFMIELEPGTAPLS